jgi:membrane protein YqaA with SNARE-associated domain
MELKSPLFIDRYKQAVTYVKNGLKYLYHLVGSCVHKPYGTFLLGFSFYLEAVCFLPADPILIVYCLERRSRAFYYALIATVSSVLGGITSYLIGVYLWEHFGTCIINHAYITRFISPAQFAYLSDGYKQNGFIAILLAGITPFFPYKAITLSAGFCKVPLLLFTLCSLLVRGIRFFSYATAIFYLGPRFKELSPKMITGISIILGLLILLIWLLTKFLFV